MKKIATIILLLCCFFMNTVASASLILEYDGGVRNYTGAIYDLYINGEKLTDLPLEPIIFNDRALVPVREVFEALGATVDYDASNKSTTVTYGKKVVAVWIDKVTATINGSRVTIPDNVAPKLIAKWGESAKTMVPARFISENVGLDVKFDGDEGAIYISEKSPRPTTSPKPSTPPAQSPEDITFGDVKITRIKGTESNGIVTITAYASGEIPEISKASATSAGVLFVDVYGVKYSVQNKTEFGFDNVMSVRVGLHDNCTRIAIDTYSMKKYSVTLSSDRTAIIFQIADSKNAELDESYVPSPSVSPSPTTPSTRPTANPTSSPKPTTTPKPSASPSVSPTPTPTPTPKPIVYSSKKYVVIDAGHGGSDPGTLNNLMTDEELELYDEAKENDPDSIATMKKGTGKEYYEKNIALSVAKMVQDYLEDEDINVIMTRSKDIYPSLDERVQIANSEGAVMFVSIHLNSTVNEVTTASGIEVYYSTQNNQDDIKLTSEKLAEYILDGAVKETKAARRGVKTGNLLVNRKCQMPSALIEIGFMNNPYELSNMASEKYQDKLARGIANGIIEAMDDVKLPKK